jgi:hypothetical protein
MKRPNEAIEQLGLDSGRGCSGPSCVARRELLAWVEALEAVARAAERDFRARDYHYTVAKALQALKEDR